MDLGRLPLVLRSVHRAIASGAVLACHDVSEGGLLATLAEMCIGARLGARIDVTGLGTRPDVALFNESAGVLLLEMAADALPDEWFAQVTHRVLGSTVPEPVLRVSGPEGELFAIAVDDLLAAWQSPMRSVFH